MARLRVSGRRVVVERPQQTAGGIADLVTIPLLDEQQYSDAQRHCSLPNTLEAPNERISTPITDAVLPAREVLP